MILEKHNLQYTGSANRNALYDVICPENGAELPLVVFCHGFKGFKDWGHWRAIFHNIAKEGFCVVKFNFTHNGVEIDDPLNFTNLNAFAENSYIKELDDIDYLIEHASKDDFIQSKCDLKKIYLIGHSRGGSIAILKAANDKRIKKLVSWAAVADLEERLPTNEELSKWKKDGVRYIPNARTKQYMPMNYQFVENFYKYKKDLSIEKACKKMKIPQLAIHGENDSTVGLEHAYALQVWNTKAQLQCIANADHVFNGKHPYDMEELPFESKQLIEATVKFLKEK